jgi:hypothetical protein
MGAEDAYIPFNDELEEIIHANPERAAAVAQIRAEMDDADPRVSDGPCSSTLGGPLHAGGRRIEIELATAAEHGTPAA